MLLSSRLFVGFYYSYELLETKSSDTTDCILADGEVELFDGVGVVPVDPFLRDLAFASDYNLEAILDLRSRPLLYD